MNTLQKTICASLVLASAACGVPLWASDGEREVALEINRANGLLRGGDVDAAIGAYQQLQKLERERGLVLQRRGGPVSQGGHVGRRTLVPNGGRRRERCARGEGPLQPGQLQLRVSPATG